MTQAVLKVTELFFDRPKVIKATERANRRGLNETGRILRRSARDSMRRRKSASNPGAPPSVHAGQLKKFLFYSYSPQTESVVVGPVKLGNSDVPRLLEEGGTVHVRDKRIRVGPKTVRGANGRFEANREYTTVSGALRYPPRPYMVPALRKNVKQIPQKWKNAVVGG